MAFNPSTYETIYGFDTLDTFHNYFPELMYDDALFNNEILHWMRYRLQTLFPQVYPRQQNMYRIYLSQARHEMFRTFQNTRNSIQLPTNDRLPIGTRIVWPTTPAIIPTTTPIIVSARRVSTSPPRSVVTAPAAAPAAASTSARIETFSVSPISTASTESTESAPNVPVSQPSESTPSASSSSSPPPTHAFPTVQVPSTISMTASGRGFASLNVHDPLEDLLTALLSTTPQTRQGESALLTSMLGGLGSLGNLGMWTTARNELLTDVLVIPTHAQVESGSEIVHLEDVPDEISCAVCQERGTDETWRHLYCEHYFHRACVDRWFSRNVHCPVCRADIRTPNSE